MRVLKEQSIVPYVILVGSLILSITAGAYDYTLSRTHARSVFDLEAKDTVQQITSTFDSYVTLLRSGRALFASNQKVDRRMFNEFAGSLRIRSLYPGMQGIGFTVKANGDEVDRLVASERMAGLDDFRVWPSWERPEYHSIIYLEPLDKRNMRAIGYDMFTEPIRREAMERARDTGAVALSGRVVLVQETPELGPVQSGCLLYCPVYRGGYTPDTMEQRRDRLMGFVYAPLRAGDMLSKATTGVDGTVLQFRIYDGSKPSLQTLMYDSSPGGDASRHFSGPLFRTLKQVEVYGRQWTIEFFSSGGETQGHFGRWKWIWLGGTLISFALFILSRGQVAAQARALRSARDLSQAREALQSANTRMTSILSSIRDGFVSFDREWRIVYINEQAAFMLRREVSQLLHRNVWEILPELEGTPLQKQLQLTMQTRKKHQVEHHAPGGEWFDARAYPSQEGVSLYFIDITDRKENEQRLYERYVQEHNVLSVLQDAMLTPSRQEVSGLDIATLYRAAVTGSRVGGDFYDIFHIDDTTVGFVIGDVEGKGIQAAAHTALVKNGLRALATVHRDPDVVLGHLNAVVWQSSIGGLVSVFYGVLDLESRKLTYASAGHEPPVGCHSKTREVWEMRCKGRVLGVAPSGSYEQKDWALQPGDCLVLYTDGLTEARRVKEFFGTQRLLETVKANCGLPAASVADGIARALTDFTGGAFSDDVAILCICC